MVFFLRTPRSCEMVLQEVSAMKTNFIGEIETGTTVIVGASSGLGRKLANEIGKLGGNLVLVCRNTFKGSSTKMEILSSCNEAEERERISVMECDLSSLVSVNKFCQELTERLDNGILPPLKLLVLNAGIKPSGRRRKVTWQGFEKTFQVNYFAHFFIYMHLREHLKENMRNGNKGSKVIYVACQSGRTGPFTLNQMTDVSEIVRKIAKPQYVEGYNADKTYSTTKLCGIMMAQCIHERDSAEGIRACSVNPGHIVKTNLRGGRGALKSCLGKVTGAFETSVDAGTALIFQCCLVEMEQLQGLYFEKYDFKSLPPIATAESAQLSLFSISEHLMKQFLKHERDFQLRKDKIAERADIDQDMPLAPLEQLLRFGLPNMRQSPQLINLDVDDVDDIF